MRETWSSDSKKRLKQSLNDGGNDVTRPCLASAHSLHVPSACPLNAQRAPGAHYSLIVMTMISVLNYMDRYMPSALKDFIKEDLELTDAQTALPITGFLVVYMCACPVFATLSDRGYSRKRLLALGVCLWSLATAGAALSHNFTGYLISRGFVGIGEAAAATIGPTLICDLYPPAERNFVFSVFALGVPIGGSLGYIIGGLLGEYAGWRTAFVICGLPGLIFGVAALTIEEPVQGAFEPPSPRDSPPSWIETLAFLARSRRFVVLTTGYVFAVFAIGGLADWLPSYLERTYGVDSGVAGLCVGTITVVSTPIGVFLGGRIADFFTTRIAEANIIIS
eukprot:g51678.t1